MPNSDSEGRAELLSLLDKQLEVLELSACVTLTDQEKREVRSKEPAHPPFAPKSRTKRRPFPVGNMPALGR